MTEPITTTEPSEAACPDCGTTRHLHGESPPGTKCSVLGCDNEADPRWAVHGSDGCPLPACDGHIELPCRATEDWQCWCPDTKEPRP